MRSRGKLIASVVALIFAYGCGGGHDAPPSPPATITGTVVKGYVLGAVVHADKGTTATRNEILDAGEQWTRSDLVTGDYTLTIPPGYGEYILVSTGGTIKGSGETAPKLRAPKDAQNITPITDLVQASEDTGLDVNDFKNIIGAGWDSDIADPAGTDPKLLELALAVNTYVKSLGEVATTMEQKNLAMETLAEKLSDEKTLANLPAAVESAVSASLNDTNIVPAGVITGSEEEIAAAVKAIATAVKDAVVSINAAIQAQVVGGNVVESPELLATAQEKASEASQEVITRALVAWIKTTQIVSKNLEGGIISQNNVRDGVGDPVELSKTQGEAIAKLDIHLFGRNDFSETKSYGTTTPASLIIGVVDANSKRSGVAEIYDIEVTVAPTLYPDHNPEIGLKVKTTSRVRIRGTNSQGTEVAATFDNKTFDGKGDLFSVSSNVLTIDLNGMQKKIQAQVGETHDLFKIGAVGAHNISVRSDNIPGEPISQKLTVRNQ